jgi:hypothetical protein
MSEQEREQFADDREQASEENDVEAHKKRALTEEPAQDDEGDDVEAHRRRA